jgi:SAM-dependent methyltransferase
MNMASLTCCVCASALGDPLFVSPSEIGLTSLCEPRAGRIRVWACAHCGHLQNEPLADTEKYYDSAYRISLDHDEEDQIYEAVNGRVVFRTEHQANVLLDVLPLKQGTAILDYGCAKAATLRMVAQRRSDIEIHLFDVSEMYLDHWQRFVTRERCATYQTPAAWQHKFDMVTSFFALEHIPDPLASVRKISDLLNEDGIFYTVVPDTFGNPVDFLVLDHVNHFTITSLHKLLERAGFHEIAIDNHSHRGALVASAKKRGTTSSQPPVAPVLQQAEGLARYWSGLIERLRTAQAAAQGMPAAIYGSGVYGSYIASSLLHLEEVECFLDRSPFQQGKTLFGKPVLAPEALPEHIKTLYVGLNPAIARKAMAELPWLGERNMHLIFLDDTNA